MQISRISQLQADVNKTKTCDSIKPNLVSKDTFELSFKGKVPDANSKEVKGFWANLKKTLAEAFEDAEPKVKEQSDEIDFFPNISHSTFEERMEQKFYDEMT